MPSTTNDRLSALVEQAADVLRRGGLVAFPTETVYGLGANALDLRAVARIFAAKGRPPNNPLIVHVADVDEAQALAAHWPEPARRLADRFWPGPLTLVLPRRNIVPDIVTAGGSTVALRVPAHPVAQALLRACGLPLAAPSANRSTQLSPTRAAHVVLSLGAAVDLVLDGGPTPGGLESTVVDVTSEPRLLRPGLVTPAQLESVVGPILRIPVAEAGPLRAPGQLDRHYAPRTPLELTDAPGRRRVKQLADAGLRVGWLAFETYDPGTRVEIVVLPKDATRYAARLYDALHQLDAAGVDRIVADLPPTTDDWLAIHDRLRRAATPLHVLPSPHGESGRG